MMTAKKVWLAGLCASGMLMACSDNNGNTTPTDASTPTDMVAPTDGTTPTDGNTTDTPRTDVPRDTTPVDRPPPANPCTSAQDLSMRMPGSDGAIHVTGDNSSAPTDGVGNLGLRGMGGCLGTTSGGDGAKGSAVVFQYTMRTAGVLTVSTDNAGTDDGFDTVVAVLGTCSATAAPLPNACNDDVSGMNLHSTASTAPLMMGQRVFIVVGGWGATSDAASTGAFELTVREAMPIAVGMPCRVGDVCASGNTCVGATTTNSGVCTANGGAGAACRTAAPFCDTGSECSVATPTATANGICLRQVAVGEACGTSSICTMGNVCPNMTTTATTGSDAGVGDGGTATAARLCAAPVMETEPNNTPATAAPVVTRNTTFRAALPAGDTDCFAITLPAGASLYAETTDARGTCNLGMGADTIINVYRMGETMPLATNDDAVGLCSRLDGRTSASLTRLAAGTYNVCVSAFSGGDGGTSTAIAEYYATIGFYP